MKNIDAKNRILKALLSKFSVDEEKLIYESEENIICEQSNICEETKVTFFITNYRIGYVTEKASYYLTSNEFLRDSIHDKENRTIILKLTDSDRANNIEMDYVIQIINSNNFKEIINKLYFIYIYRYEKPMECTHQLIDNVIYLLYEYKFEEALKVLKKVSDLDCITGVSKLLEIKIYKLMGNPQKSTLTLAQSFNKFTTFSPVIFMSEIMEHDWSKEVLNYLPNVSSVDNEIDKCVLNCIHAVIDDNKEAALSERYNFIKCLVKQGNVENAIYISLKSLFYGAELYDKSKSFDEIYNLAVKLLKLKLSKLKDNSEKEDCQSLINSFNKLRNGPIKFIKENFDSKPFKLIYANNFHELLNMEFDKKEIEKLDSYNILSIENYEFADPYSDFCQHQIFTLFAELRSSECRPQELFTKLKKLDELLDEQNRRCFDNRDQLLVILYYMISCEIHILNERKRECLKIIIEFRKRLKKCKDLPLHEVQVYEDEIASFYEAWALGSLCQMKKVADSIPKDKLIWLHELCEKNNSLAKAVNTEDDALDLLNHVVLRFKSIAKSRDIITEEDREEILDSIHIIESRLEDDELRIAVVGETSAGKSTFLNTLFNTDLFFATQEEATGVSTEIRKGNAIEVEVLDKDNNVRSAFNTKRGSWFNRIVDYDGKNQSSKKGLFNNLTGKSNEKEFEGLTAAQFVSKHTKVGEEALEWVYKVRVKLPIEELPDNVVIVDTPGFNANEQRTQIAKREISNAHVCLFLIDARNALKKKEMEILDLIEGEAGKVYFILNKMDSVTYDEDLDDLDDMNEDELIDKVAKELMDRVKTEIKKYLKVDKVKVYQVSSIYKESAKDKIKEYFYNVQKVKEDIFNESNNKKLDLLINMAAKEAIKVSNIIVKVGQESIGKLEEEEKALTESLPSDPELFKSLIEKRIFSRFYRLKDNYVEKLSGVIAEKFEAAKDEYYNWIESVDSKIELNNNAQRQAETILGKVIEEIDEIKTEELSAISKEILNEIIVVFKELYSNLSFNKSLKSEDLTKYIYNLNANQISSISNIKGKISNSTVAGGIVGASIGMIFGPIGALVGGFIGTKIMGGGDTTEMKKQIWEAYYKALMETNDSIIDSFNEDLKFSASNSFVSKFIDIIDEQITKYEGVIKNKILVTYNYLNERHNVLFIFKEKIYRINDDIAALKNWRKSRGV